MTEHVPFERMLARYHELADQERTELDAHLRVCRWCRQRFEEYSRQDADLEGFVSTMRHFALASTVLREIERVPDRERRWAWVPGGKAWAAAAMACMLLLCAVMLAAVIHGRLSPASGTPLASCNAPDAGWYVTGPCEVVASSDSFRRPGVIFYTWSVQWARSHLRHPQYVVRRARGFPIAFTENAGHVYYSQLAFDPSTHAALYVIGDAMEP